MKDIELIRLFGFRMLRRSGCLLSIRLDGRLILINRSRTVASCAELVCSLLVHWIDPFLVQVDEEYDIFEKQQTICNRNLKTNYKTYKIPSLKHPIRYIVGILITKAKMSSMNVFKAL